MQNVRRPGWSPSLLDALLWLLIAFLLVPALVALDGLPWAQRLPGWLVPVTLLCGLGLGAIIVLGTIPTRRWWSPLVAAPLLGAAVAAGALLSGRATESQQAPIGTLLLGAFGAGLGAAVPWLVLRVRQSWLALALIWVTIAGAWGGQLSPRQTWWLVWLLVGTLLLLGLSHLRDEVNIWKARNLERIGPVLWPSARAAMALSLLAALLGLVPLGVLQVANLSHWWHQLPIAQGGPLAYDSPSGSPAAVLGAPLSMNAPDVSSSQIVLTYRLVNIPADPSGAPFVVPPLLGTTFDTFDGTTWTQAAQTTTVPASALSSPAAPSLLTASITVKSLPASEHTTYLLGFDEPLSYSVPARASVVTSDAPSPVSLMDWQTTASLTSGTTYTSTSAVLPIGFQASSASGALSSPLLTRLTATPPQLTAELRATALNWLGSTATQSPTVQAQALLTALQAHATIDLRASPVPDIDPISGFLQTRRGNVLLYTTAYILLGRALGLPLRLAEGYLPGAYDTKLNAMVVHASDASVWAQLAIPGVGWQDLFPASTTLTILVPGKIVYSGVPEAPSPTPASQSAAQSSAHASARNARQGANAPSAWVVGSLVVFALLLLVLAGVAATVRLRWSRVGAGLSPLAQFFVRVGVLARIAGIRLRPSDTATQATSKVATKLPEHANLLGELNLQYERTRYGPPGDQGIVANLREQWQRVRGALTRLVVNRLWRRSPR
jgi:transglutaminase-like putative cysteine protease